MVVVVVGGVSDICLFKEKQRRKRRRRRDERRTWKNREREREPDGLYRIAFMSVCVQSVYVCVCGSVRQCESDEGKEREKKETPDIMLTKCVQSHSSFFPSLTKKKRCILH